ncbi:MAG: Mur ligase family protein [Patescibacteria group bacterium]|nr:Mur ligase family protein [Patescibacteria group bacterium]
MKKVFKFFIQFYLKLLTKAVIWRHKPLIIAVAGTTNKTFIKEVILDELGRGVDVRGNPKSFNTEIGLPLAVLYLPSGYSSIFRWVDVLLTGSCISVFSRKFPRVLVLEMGVDQKGDMEYLLSMVKPTIAVLTTVKGDFSQNETYLDDIVDELGCLVASVPKGGAVILNGEDERVRKLEEKTNVKVVVHGNDQQCDARISNVESTVEGQKFSLEYKGKAETIKTERRGRHNVNALVVAKIVATQLKEIKKGQ